MIVAVKPKPPAKHIRADFDDDDDEDDLVCFMYVMKFSFCSHSSHLWESHFLFFVRLEI